MKVKHDPYWDRLNKLWEKGYGSLATYQSVIFNPRNDPKEEMWVEFSKKEVIWGMQDQNFDEETQKNVLDFLEGKRKDLEAINSGYRHVKE